MTKSYTV